jgi:hypothetical protein
MSKKKTYSLKDIKEQQKQWLYEVTLTIYHNTPQGKHIELERTFDNYENMTVTTIANKLSTIEKTIIPRLQDRKNNSITIEIMNKSKEIIGERTIDKTPNGYIGITQDNAVEYIKIIRE